MNHSFFFEYGEMLAKFCLCFDDTLYCCPHSINSLTLSIIYIYSYIITQSCSVFSSSNLSPSRLSQVYIEEVEGEFNFPF